MSTDVRMAYAREQYSLLVWLAWGLYERGVSAGVVLSRGQEPSVVVPRASDPLKIRATRRGEEWVYTWGRGRDQETQAHMESVARLIAERLVKQ